MKKIFLTSGLVLCMACPAFADLTAPIDGHNNGIVSGTDLNPEDPSCRVGTLEGYSGTSTFVANWTAVYKQITINSNIGTDTATGGVSTLTPTPLYTVPGRTLVWTGKDSNQNLTGGSENAGIGDGGLVLTNSPMVTEGATATYTINLNKPQGATGTPATGTASVTSPKRPFLGVYDSGTGSNQYIDANGRLTSTGASAASSNNSDSTTWYAKYGSVVPVITGEPTLTGYSFQGWSQSASGSVMDADALAAWSITENTPVYAIWQAVNYHISFDCGKPAAGATIPGLQTNYAVSASQNPSSAPAQRTIAMDGTINLTETCSLNGWRFDGWNCTAGLTSGSSTETATTFIAAADLAAQNGFAVNLRTAGDVACTARWTQNNITLSWDNDHATSGGTGGGGSCDYDGGITMPSTPSRTGYTFNGWTVTSSNPANQ